MLAEYLTLLIAAFLGLGENPTTRNTRVLDLQCLLSLLHTAWRKSNNSKYQSVGSTMSSVPAPHSLEKIQQLEIPECWIYNVFCPCSKQLGENPTTRNTRVLDLQCLLSLLHTAWRKSNNSKYQSVGSTMSSVPAPDSLEKIQQLEIPECWICNVFCPCSTQLGENPTTRNTRVLDLQCLLSLLHTAWRKSNNSKYQSVGSTMSSVPAPHSLEKIQQLEIPECWIYNVFCPCSKQLGENPTTRNTRVLDLQCLLSLLHTAWRKSNNSKYQSVGSTMSSVPAPDSLEKIQQLEIPECWIYNVFCPCSTQLGENPTTRNTRVLDLQCLLSLLHTAWRKSNNSKYQSVGSTMSSVPAPDSLEKIQQLEIPECWIYNVFCPCSRQLGENPTTRNNRVLDLQCLLSLLHTAWRKSNNSKYQSVGSTMSSVPAPDSLEKIQQLEIPECWIYNVFCPCSTQLGENPTTRNTRVLDLQCLLSLLQTAWRKSNNSKYQISISRSHREWPGTAQNCQAVLDIPDRPEVTEHSDSRAGLSAHTREVLQARTSFWVLPTPHV
ncbi:hypothetical protein RRG08_063574 [Elysia crispata]|uniref:Uncharacterized protein n=1 Tax=Elysia crispata TaxID=231223 RepID=A0AAE1D3U9_9GAST|nr:hypothetical protein RRG08_063574 [Elysia crispata]